MLQETQRKYTKPSYTIKYLGGDPKVRWNDDLEKGTRRMGINWRNVAQDTDGWRCWRGAYFSWIVDPHLKIKIQQFIMG
jgi:hypothetical protein